MSIPAPSSKAIPASPAQPGLPATAEAAASRTPALDGGLHRGAAAAAEPPRLSPPAAAAPRAAQPSVADLPADLRDTILSLEEWAVKNQSEAQQDARAFWRLKIPAIVISSGAGVVAYFDSTLLSQVVGMIAAILVAIDGIQPKGQLRAVRYRAFSDIRNLEHTMMAEWRSRPDAESDTAAARRIIRQAEPERIRIHSYLRDIEAPMAGS